MFYTELYWLLVCMLSSCPICTEVIPLTYLFQITHESGRRFSCEHCDRCFTDPSNLQRHIRSQHHGARCHACTDCGKTFATSSGLKQHQHIHSSVKPFQCEVCLKAYTQFSNLCRHKRMHADCRQQIKCNDCGQAFSTITSLSKHKRFCEGALRNGMRLGYSGDAKLSTTARGLPHVSPTSPFSPALMMGLYGSRPPYPFYQPMGSNFTGMFPAGHPLAALTSLSPGNIRSSAFSFASTKAEYSPSEKFSDKFEDAKRMPRTSECSDAASDSLSGSDLENIPSDSESEKSCGRKSADMVQKVPDISVTKSKTPELSHSVPAILSQPQPNSFLSKSSPRAFTFDHLPPSLTKEEPFDLSKVYKPEHITPKTSPTVEPQSGEQPLDLSRTKEMTPPEAPRKTHVFGEAKTPVTAEQRLHYAYPQFSSPLVMEQVLRMSEKKEKSPESSSFLPYTRFPFTSPSQYSMGVNPFSMVVNRETTKPVQSPAFSPAAKSLEPTYHYTSPSQYSSPNKVKDRYACKFCGKIFPRSANLTRHLRTHTGEQPYKCKYCERSFSISSNLQRHVRNIHNKEKPFRCALCDRCFGQQTNLDRHLKKHETDGMNLPDSPENESENVELDDKDESYFAEIRNFIGKATETDVNQNSLPVNAMKVQENKFENTIDNSFEEENDAELDVGGPGDMDEAGTDVSDQGENELDNNFNETGEPANKKSRLADQLLMSSINSDTPLPLCQKPTFELKRCFSPLVYSP